MTGKHDLQYISRRDFLRAAGLAVGGAAVGAGGVALSFAAQTRQAPKAKGHIVLLPPAESACTGCGTCELVCAAAHGDLVGPSRRRLWLKRDGINLAYEVLTCLQCDYPACYAACPRPDEALCIDQASRARYIVPAACPAGCRRCLEACPLAPARINYDRVQREALMCDLCRDRAQGPACVEFCPAACLALKA